MRYVVDLVYVLAGLAYLPIALYNALVVGKNRRGWAQRFGGVPRFDPSRPRIWIHAVSLGEINATPRLVEALERRLPQFDVVISTTTDTGYARGVRLYGANRVFRFPLDFSFAIARALRRVRPTLIVLIELEVWYNLIAQAHRRGVSVAVVNGRLTERSRRRFARLGGLVRPMFDRIDWVGAQDETIATRFASVGVRPERIEVTSSMKWDTAQVADQVDGTDALRAEVGLVGDGPIWVCGSTGPGEEAMVLQALDGVRRRIPSIRVVIVPRKPERFDDVADLIRRHGLTFVRRSEARSNRDADAPAPPVILGDTMGELRKFYSLADVVFVGRSLVPMGGSDPIEVAALGKPVVVGPHMDNFQMPLEALVEAQAVRIVDSPESLGQAVVDLLGDPGEARRMGAAGRGVVLDHQGATNRTVERLVALAERAPRCP